MKLDGELRLEPCLVESSECLEDGHRAGAVVVRARCWEERKCVVRRILVCTDNDAWHLDGVVVWGSSAHRLEPSDHARLGQRT